MKSYTLRPDIVTHTELQCYSFRYFMLLKVAVGTRTQDYVRVVVSTNVFDSNLKLDHQFDLKGSTANRWISASEQVAAMEKKGKLPCLKDLNWKKPLALAQSDLDLLHAQVRREERDAERPERHRRRERHKREERACPGTTRMGETRRDQRDTRGEKGER